MSEVISLALPASPLKSLLDDFARRGLTLRTSSDGKSLRTYPAASEEDRAAIREHKAALLAIAALRCHVILRCCYSPEERQLYVDDKMVRLWQAAAAACAPDVVTITGEVSPERAEVINGLVYPSNEDGAPWRFHRIETEWEQEG